MDDSTIILQVKQGKIEKFELLVERYHRPLLSFIHTLTRDPFLTEDIGQSVFFSFFTSLNSYDETMDTPVVAWLFTAARNQTINTLKQERRFVITDTTDHRAASDARNDPLALLIDKEDRETLERCLQILPQPYRNTLRASLQGSSIKELALLESIAPGTIKSRLHRARQKCATLFHALRQEL